jgi:hypothetical protein
MLLNVNQKGKNQMGKKTESPKPCFEQRYNHIRLTVWENVSKGQSYFNVVITRRYRDGDDWKESSSFSGLGDLALVAAAVKSAEEFLRGKALSSYSDSESVDVVEGL